MTLSLIAGDPYKSQCLEDLSFNIAKLHPSTPKKSEFMVFKADSRKYSQIPEVSLCSLKLNIWIVGSLRMSMTFTYYLERERWSLVFAVIC